MKIVKMLSIFAVSLCFFQQMAAQNKCGAKEIYSQKKCAGDEQTKEETELFRLINEYRGQNDLPAVGESKNLSMIANRHLMDINLNLKKLTHSWSDCRYDPNDSTTWRCILDAPKKFDPAFTGAGFENVYFNSKGNFSPAEILDGWKKSPLHNSVILNLNAFKNNRWNAGGVAIDGRYACLWFTSAAVTATNAFKKSEGKGLGISFRDAVKNLTTVLSVNAVSSTGDSDKWIGASADKSVYLEIYGKPEKVEQGRFSIRVRLDKPTGITPRNKNLLAIFLENVSPDWLSRGKWLDEAVQKLTTAPNSPVSAVRNDIVYEVSVDQNKFLILTVKPKSKSNSVEY